ncbi:hypothetical protein ABMA27_011231 [Loxostege sticticalis]|uniref:LIM zinc-binding domain-containing protein n=1 Tax=Loxostege sticticalis TaxID=481309 RepID=A0ABR3H1S0_LOXSC
MHCVVCQHCQGQVRKEDGVAVQEGYSYHKKCHKCYVCSETDLHNAEVFKGVIFCYSCSQKSKNGNRSQSARIKTKAKRKERRHQQSKDFKKQSTEMGMTTEVTLELLRQMNCPIPERKHWHIYARPFFNPVSVKFRIYKNKKQNKKYISIIPSFSFQKKLTNETIICSDLRVAELGASTEIAHMALRKRSEVPVIIKSESDMKAMDSLSLESEGNQGSGNFMLPLRYVSKTICVSDFSDSILKNVFLCRGLLNRTVESILKMPYKSFKKNILDRSSLITVLMNSDKESWLLLKRLKMIFHEEITEHRRRGVKRLYSTINRRRTPYRLGWPELALNNKIQPSIRCKHFNRSHSYRCMRAQVMRLAGPTKSELKTLRKKLKDTIAPQFVKDIIGFHTSNRHRDEWTLLPQSNLPFSLTT